MKIFDCFKFFNELELLELRLMELNNIVDISNNKPRMLDQFLKKYPHFFKTSNI